MAAGVAWLAAVAPDGAGGEGAEAVGGGESAEGWFGYWAELVELVLRFLGLGPPVGAAEHVR